MIKRSNTDWSDRRLGTGRLVTAWWPTTTHWGGTWRRTPCWSDWRQASVTQADANSCTTASGTSWSHPLFRHTTFRVSSKRHITDVSNVPSFVRRFPWHINHLLKSSPRCASTQSQLVWASGICCCRSNCLELTERTPMICVIWRLSLTVSDVCS